MNYECIVVVTLTMTVSVNANNDQEAAHRALSQIIDIKNEIEASHDLNINEHDYSVTSVIDENGKTYGRHANHGTD